MNWSHFASCVCAASGANNTHFESRPPTYVRYIHEAAPVCTCRLLWSSWFNSVSLGRPAGWLAGKQTAPPRQLARQISIGNNFDGRPLATTTTTRRNLIFLCPRQAGKTTREPSNRQTTSKRAMLLSWPPAGARIATSGARCAPS